MRIWRPKFTRRGVARLALVCLLLALVGRVILGFALPGLLARAVEPFDLQLTVEEFDLSVFGGDVELWHLVMRGTDNERPYIDAEYVRLDLSVLELLSGHIVLHRVESDGLDAWITRDADGELDLVRHFTNAETDAPVVELAASEADSDGEPGAIDPTSPVSIDALRLQSVRLRWTDLTLDPPLQARVDVNFRLSDLASRVRPTRLDLEVLAAPFVDALEIEAEGFTDDGVRDLTLSTAIRRWRPGAMAGYLKPLGLQPVAESLDVGLHAELRAAANEGGPDMSLTARLTDVFVKADGVDAVRLEAIDVAIPHLGPEHIEIADVSIAGGQASTAILPDGRMRIAGIDLVGGATGQQAEPAPTTDKSTGPGPSLHLARLAVTDIVWRHHGERVQPPVDLDLRLQRLIVSDVSLPVAPDDPPTVLDVRMAAPGLFDATDISAQLTAGPVSEFELDLATRGLATATIQPYLDGAGLDGQLADANLHLWLAGRWKSTTDGLEASLQLRDLTLAEGADELFALDRFEIDRVAIGDAGIVIDQIALSGTRLPARRLDDGRLSVLGIQTRTTGATSAPSADTLPPVADDAAMNPPAPPSAGDGALALAVGAIRWDDVRLTLTDEAFTPPLAVPVSFGLSVDQVTLDGPTPQVGGFLLWLGSPDVAERIALEGRLTDEGGNTVLAAQLRGEGLTGRLARPLLAPAGIEPTLEDGTLTVDITGTLAAGALDSLAITGVEFRDGETRLAACGAVRLGGFRADEGRTWIGPIEIVRPWLAASRDAEGGLSALGFRLAPADPEADAELEPPATVTDAESDPTGTESDPTGAESDPTGAETAGGLLFLEGLELTGARVEWTDALLAEPLTTALEADVRVTDVGLGGPAEPFPFAIDLRFPDSASTLDLTGKARLQPDDLLFELSLDGRGLHPSPLYAYLAPDSPARLWAGDVRASLNVASTETGEPEARIRRSSLDARLDHLVLVDPTRPDAEPLTIEGVRLWTPEAAELDLADPEASPPVGIALTASATPVLDQLDVTLTATPFEGEPHLDLDVALTGLRGAGLHAVRPELTDTLDASELVDGRFGLHAEVTIDSPRRDPFEFDIASGLSGEVLVSNVAFRDGEGPVVLGLDELRLELANLSPDRVHVRELELRRPVAHLTRTADALRLGNLALPLPAPTGAEAEAGAEPEADAEPVDPNAPPRVRVDTLAIGDIDVVFDDLSVTPALHLPLTGLDLEVKGWNDKALVRPVPITFTLLMEGGPMLAELSEEAVAPPIFEEIDVTGRLTLAPVLTGSVRTAVRSLELVALSGPAADAGVELKAGRFDADVGVDFPGDGSMTTTSHFAFTDLDLSEDENGPIKRFLQLPTPTSAALFVLRDEDGVIALDVDFTVEEDGLSATEITRVAASTTSGLIIDAIKASPFRVVGSVGDIAGGLTDTIGLGGVTDTLTFGMFSDDEQPEIIDGFDFDPADTSLGAISVERLDQLCEYIEDGRYTIRLGHELGAIDVANAANQANPPASQARDLSDDLRRRRRELQDQHFQIVSQLRAAVGAGMDEQATDLRQRLLRCDDELGRTEIALDYTLELLRPGSERKAQRRTRAACLAIASARMAAVKSEIVQRLGESYDEYVRIAKPRFREPVHEAGGRVSVALVDRRDDRGFFERWFGWLGFGSD